MSSTSDVVRENLCMDGPTVRRQDFNTVLEIMIMYFDTGITRWLLEVKKIKISLDMFADTYASKRK